MFNRNVWVHAFHEPDPQGLIDLGIPVDHIMFGSDFPHPEGMADPLAYSEVVKDMPLENQALIMGGSLEKAMKVGKYALRDRLLSRRGGGCAARPAPRPEGRVGHRSARAVVPTRGRVREHRSG